MESGSARERCNDLLVVGAGGSAGTRSGGILSEADCEPRSEMRSIHLRAEDDLYH